jgi:hypothetical protein
MALYGPGRLDLAAGIAGLAARGLLYYLTRPNFWVNCVFLLDE